jgi:hypothetical protein
MQDATKLAGMTEDPMDTTKLVAACEVAAAGLEQLGRSMELASARVMRIMRGAGEMLSENAELQKIMPRRR